MAESTFSSVIDAERVSQELGYAELSRRSGLRPSTTYDILTGRRPDPQLSTLLALLSGLARDLRWLHAQGIRPEKNLGKSPQ